MILIYGTKLYGKVDIVPGLFHVETRFGHLWYFPILPLESYVVLGKSGDGFNGVRIPLNVKSVVFAWLRAGTLTTALISLICAAVEWNRQSAEFSTAMIIGFSSLATFLVLAFQRGSTQASYQRAFQIGQMIGLSDRGMLQIERIYSLSEELEPETVLSESGDRFKTEI